MEDIELKIIFLFTIFLMISASITDSEKCTAQDKRNIFDSCALDYRNMALWCDYTNFTCIPNPDDIKSQAPCNWAQYLFFNDSCLTRIHSDTLKKYNSLKVADFSDNQLTEINDTTFSIVSLEVLDLSKNNISTIAAKAFSGLLRLEKLRLAGNNLSLLPIHIFKKLTKLQILEIDNNLLATLSEQLFPEHSSLKKLNFENNKLKVLFRPHHRQFVHLETIKAGGNQLEVLRRRNFAHLYRLRSVHFENNELVEVEVGAFDHTTRLQTVDLRNNKLKFLPKDLLSKNCELHSLMLSGNSFTFIHPELFAVTINHKEMFPSIQLNIDLKSNPWCCDCGMADFWELLQFLKKSRSSLRDVFDVNCHYPKEWRESNLSGISRHHLSNCSSQNNNSSSSELASTTYSIAPKCENHNFFHAGLSMKKPKFEYLTQEKLFESNPGSATLNLPKTTLILNLLSIALTLVL